MYTYQSQRVETFREALSLEHHAQLVHLSNLGLGKVTGVAILRLLGLVGEVVVVVFGVDIHGGGFDKGWRRREIEGYLCTGTRGREEIKEEKPRGRSMA